MSVIWYIIIGIVSGFIAGKIMRGGGFGLLINLLVGIIGGLLGGWVFGLLGIATGGILGSLITSVVGAVSVSYTHLISWKWNRKHLMKAIIMGCSTVHRKNWLLSVRGIIPVSYTHFSPEYTLDKVSRTRNHYI